MKRSMTWALAVSVMALGGMGLGGVPAQAADPQYKALPTIAIGGGSANDYVYVDGEGRRLYVTHGTKVVVVDIDQNKAVAEVPDTAGVHGFATAPELKRGFSSNGQANTSNIVDLEIPAAPAGGGLPQLKIISKVTTGSNPDAILYEPKSGEVWTFNGRSNNATAFEAKTGKVIATIPLPGKPETGVADAEAGRVYVNLEDKSTVCVIDLKEHKVLDQWPIAPGVGATGMAMDHVLHRLILGCGNSKMVMMDATNGKVVASVNCGAGVDAAAFDPGTHLAFASAGGSGNVTIAKVDADKLTVVQTLSTEGGAKTMAVDPKTHRIFLAHASSRTDPNSFKVLVYGIDETAKP